MKFLGNKNKKKNKEEESAEEETSTFKEKKEPTVSESFGKIWECYSPRFQVTKYYRYGEMDTCEKFWEAFYESVERHTGKPLPTIASNRRDRAVEECEKKVMISKEEKKFQSAWEIMDREVAEKIWRKRYKDVMPDVDDERER